MFFEGATHPTLLWGCNRSDYRCGRCQCLGPSPSDCEIARDRAKSKYGAVRYRFDHFNQCMMQSGEDFTQCQAALNDQQAALGDFIFAQRVAQDVCGREGQSGDMVR